jgi:hypothetical protein
MMERLAPATGPVKALEQVPEIHDGGVTRQEPIRHTLC